MFQQFVLHLVEGQSVRDRDRTARLHLACEVGNGPFQIGVVARQRQGGTVLLERVGERSAAVVDFGQPPDRRQILRCAPEHVLELGLCLV